MSLRVLAEGRMGYTAEENDYQVVRQILTVLSFNKFLRQLQNARGCAISDADAVMLLIIACGK